MVANGDGVGIGMVSSMLVDARGRLWVSRYGDGVGLIQAQQGNGPASPRRLSVGDVLQIRTPAPTSTRSTACSTLVDGIKAAGVPIHHLDRGGGPCITCTDE